MTVAIGTTLRRLYAISVYYPTLFWNCLLGRWLKLRNWWDRIDPSVIVGATPFDLDVERLYEEGVRAVVNTCEEYAGPSSEYQRLQIEQLWIPTTDFTHPKLEDVRTAVEFVERYAKLGHTVYIHCKAGRARSATIALCWLVKYRDMTTLEAQKHLLKARPHVHPKLYQRPVVREFVKALRS